MNAQALHLIGAVLSESPSPRTRNSIIELEPSDPDSVELFERVKRAQEKWRKDSVLPESAVAEFVQSIGTHNGYASELYVSLCDPRLEREGQMFNAAILESNFRAAQRREVKERETAQRKVFSTSLNRRIAVLLGSRKTRSC
jgi:hypothetical protein